MTTAVRALTGADIRGVLNELAQLRMTVFRTWPYLYDGSEAYEAEYLSTLAAAPGGVCVVAEDDGRIVGASTAAPMREHADEFGSVFASAGYDIAKVFYCAESVLLESHRGRGLGHTFFDMREAHARSIGGFETSTFCRVVRPDDHPLRPDEYRPLDPFWRKRGYSPKDGLLATYPWKDIDQDDETEKTMQFWVKPL